MLAPVLAGVGLWCVHVTARPFGGAYLYFPLTAVWASSLYGGLVPGVASLALSLLGFDYLFLGKPGHLGVANAQEGHRLLEFALAGIAGAFICARYRSARLAAQRAEREVRRVGALQERLVAVVGHDLRNPLASLRMGLDLLDRCAPLEARQRRVVGGMQRSARRMEHLVEDLLGFARSRAGKGFPICPRPSRLGETCSHIVAELQAAYPDRAIRLSIEDDREELLDEARIEQVVANLVSNALRHGSVSAPVEVGVRGSSDELVLSVTNRGAPIDGELLPHLFEPFRSGGTKTDGLGLGLFVVREVVAAHGGSVAVRSTSAGTTFEVHLPAARRPR